MDTARSHGPTTRPASLPGDPAALLAALAADGTNGLAAAEAGRRLAAHGPNEPAPIPEPSALRTLGRQFASKLIWILVLATAASAAVGEWLNAAAIGITVAVTAAFGFFNEWRSERAIAALSQLTARRAEVVRDGAHEDIPARDVVPGDLVVVDDGDVIPADARVLQSRGLLVNESILTGEAEAVPKDIAEGEGDTATPANMLFAGTTVAGGSATAVVVATGPATRLGSIFAAVHRSVRKPTPLELRLDMLGNRLIAVFLGVCALIVAVGLAQGREPRLVVELAVSLAIGAVPEGLPAVTTAALAIAVRRLAARQVLVRRLAAVETLGSTSVIVTDKTGTLTENRMVVRSVLLDDGREVPLDVRAHAGRRIVTTARSDVDATAAARAILEAGVLCNDALLEHDDEHGWHTHGDPLEGAILVAAAGLGIDLEELARRFPRTATEPFSTATRMMLTTHDGRVAVKGALEQVAAWTGDRAPALRDEVHALGDAGYRVLAVAGGGEGGRRLLGAIVLEDPIRADAREAVGACRDAGITLVLVTGDQLATATTVARETGILQEGGRVIMGADFDADDADSVAVVARATHERKEEIVAALQGRGEVVAMTGDGVNDAAALRASHVGVAVGPNATDVAVDAADIYLSAGDLLSLVEGIREGRQVTKSLREAIIYLLSASFATIVLIGAGMVVSETPPLGPLQILWLNLVVHIFPALALAVSREAVAVPPGPTNALFTRAMWVEMAIRAAIAAAAGATVLVVLDHAGAPVGRVQAGVYFVLALVLVGQSFLIGVSGLSGQLARLRRGAVWAAAAISVALLVLGGFLPGLRNALGLEVATWNDLLLAGAASVIALNTAQIAVVLIARRLSGAGAAHAGR